MNPTVAILRASFIAALRSGAALTASFPALDFQLADS
jgi:hypothetical protein